MSINEQLPARTTQTGASTTCERYIHVRGHVMASAPNKSRKLLQHVAGRAMMPKAYSTRDKVCSCNPLSSIEGKAMLSDFMSSPHSKDVRHQVPKSHWSTGKPTQGAGEERTMQQGPTEIKRCSRLLNPRNNHMRYPQRLKSDLQPTWSADIMYGYLRCF